MKENTDILIIGGGMAGLSMAIAVARLDLHVTIVEKTAYDTQHLPAFDGRVSAISLGSKRMLDRLGVWQHMEAFAEPILDIRVSDGHSPFFLHYDHEEVGEEPFGWIVENRHTRQALYKVVQENESIRLHIGSARQLEQTAEAATVHLHDDTAITAKLVIAADGKFSKIREMAGIAVHSERYKQTALVCTIHHTQPHYGLAQERFLARGPFAVLPMQPPLTLPPQAGGGMGGGVPPWYGWSLKHLHLIIWRSILANWRRKFKNV